MRPAFPIKMQQIAGFHQPAEHMPGGLVAFQDWRTIGLKYELYAETNQVGFIGRQPAMIPPDMKKPPEGGRGGFVRGGRCQNRDLCP